MQHRQPRHGVHRGAGQIVVLANADQIGVGKLVVEQRVRERAVAVVSVPGAGERRERGEGGCRKTKNAIHGALMIRSSPTICRDWPRETPEGRKTAPWCSEMLRNAFPLRIFGA